MNSIEANIRSTKTKGELNSLRSQGAVPGVVYGGKEQNQNISFSKKNLKTLLERENFLSNIINLKISKCTIFSKHNIMFAVSILLYLL